MNSKRFVLISACVSLLLFSSMLRSEDIDIYSSNSSGGVNTPNMMFVLDSSANSDGAFGGCAYYDTTGPSLNGSKVLGNEQCALVNIVHDMPTRTVTDPTTGVTSQVAYINLGVTTASGLLIQLTPIDDNPYTGPSAVGTAIIPAGFTNRNAFIWAVKHGYDKNTGTVNQGAEMQEAWAYYTGGNQGTSGTANGIGSISGKAFSTGVAVSGCMSNYITFIGASPPSAHALESDGASPLNLITAVNNAVANGIISSTKGTALKANFNSVINPENPWAMEWSRFMHDVDANSSATGSQPIKTYTVNLDGGDTEMTTYWRNIANYGGGKSFIATDYNTLVISILKILNEVQAVNSVFSSSSLPVSVNAQGTFLNQIYMGMFRPDSEANPRWLGNLKQYQFVYDPAAGGLQLGDSISNSALSSAGTGFLSPNAISFWTCTDQSVNPYVTSTNPVNLTAEQKALMVTNNQTCADPVDGFWKNDPSSATSIAQGYDLPDGERVERGGAAQQIRHTNLTVNYTTSPAAPRKLYTHCPTGSGCVASLTDGSNIFATTNAALTASMFGTTLSSNISSITRSGTTATVTTSGNHGFSSGDLVTIANATDNTYNVTDAVITVVDGTHFTYAVAEYPPTPATGSYTTAKAGATSDVSSITRSGNTVTVTTAVAHGLPAVAGLSVVVSGVTPAEYNGLFAYTWIDSTQFSYTLAEQPATAAGTGTVAPISQATAYGFSDATCKTAASVNISAWNAASSGVSRTLGATTATVNTSASIPFSKASSTFKCPITITGVVDSSGKPVTLYNGTFSITNTAYVSSTSFTIKGLSISPTSPGSGGTVSLAAGELVISSLTRVDIAATATATATATTAAAHSYAVGDSVSVSGTGPSTETAYLGTFTVTATPTASSFNYVINTTPASPAAALTGSTMTATRSTGFVATDMTKLINWVRGEDNVGDEKGPGGSVTLRPSVHGDVLHSRPTVLNYGSYPITILSTEDVGTMRTATASSADVATIVGSGSVPVVTFANKQACPVTVKSATTFEYFNTNCGMAGAQSANVGSKIVVFYGDNGGVFHAVNGNQTADFGSTGPGDEMWGFIPKEFFIKLNRQRTNTPQLNLPSTPPGIAPTPRSKDYFVDGATGVYQEIDSNGDTTRAILYLSVRRGGNFIYALDVTTPASPFVLWKIDNTSSGMGELGQAWSQPKAARVSGYPNPVVIFGAGYDANQDSEPIAAADVSGRGIFVLDALTGAVVWKATYTGGAASCSGTATSAACLVPTMKWSIPADISLVDRTSDGYIDRLYAADTGGNIWRVDLQPGSNSTPNYWKIHQLASLGCWGSPCAAVTSPTQRKFFYAPEVIPATTNYPYDSVIIGSGDREHPLYVSTSTQRYNRLFLVKDTYTGNDATGMTPTYAPDLFDATNTAWDGSEDGYYITLAAGEKVVNAPLVVAGYAYMSTNTPASPTSNSCTDNLGIAKGYRLAPYTGQYRYVVFEGGGLPPSPVAGVVNVVVDGRIKLVPFIIGGGNPDCVGPDCQSALGGQKPPITVSTKRTRTYWYQEGK